MSKSGNPIDKHVGSRVRLRRMMLGMSQSNLGEALGLTFQQVQKYEKGANRIGASRLQRLSQVMQVPIAYFFEGAPNVDAQSRPLGTPIPAYVSDFLASADGFRLTQAFMRITSTELRKRIVQLATELSGVED
jgi:transcriptional regulator with XRE-family HTH domain